jgi:hypothetical protein
MNVPTLHVLLRNILLIDMSEVILVKLISGESFSAVPVKYEHFIYINPTSLTKM